MDFDAILVCGHGSKKKEGIQAFVQLAEKMGKRYSQTKVEYGFLELAKPDYHEAIKKLYDQGYRRIMAVPVFLFSGVHMNYEIPEMMQEFQNEMEGLEISLAPNVGISDELIQLAEKRIIEADYDRYGKSIDHTDDLLLTIGVGSSVSDANADIAKLSRYIWEKNNFGFSEYAFISKMTFPSVQDVLEIIRNMPFKRIVALPLLLFPGLYLDKVFMAIEDFRKEVNKEVIFAEPFGPDDLLLDILEKRMQEAGTVSSKQ